MEKLWNRSATKEWREQLSQKKKEKEKVKREVHLKDSVLH